MRFADGYWDETAGWLRSPAEGEVGRHRVRESAWYALGLLMRQAPGDKARAARILDQVLRLQYLDADQPWAGTFPRYPEEAAAGPGAKLWRDYDPNWRQFIGITFALILERHADQLPADLPPRLRTAVLRATEGEVVQGRAEPYHTNIALLQCFLLGWSGRQFNRPEWVEHSDAWAGELCAQFQLNQSFDEYNSPTYYGVDLYGLALWRQYGATERIRACGAEMEAGLWADIARFYHAGLRNMCGPFDRTYGIDQQRYVSLVGVWLALVLPPEATPLPDPSGGPMDHGHDYLFGINAAALGLSLPPERLDAFRRFSGERTLVRPITAERIATAWLAPDLMLGGEITGGKRPAGPRTSFGQFVPASMHWRAGAEGLGWMVLRECPPVDARASAGRLDITTTRGDSTFWLGGPVTAAMLTSAAWTMPHLAVRVETDASRCTVTAGTGYVAITYHGATRITLHPLYQP